MKLDQNRKVCAEFTYLLKSSLRDIIDAQVSLNPKIAKKNLNDKRIYKVYNDSEGILEVVSQFLTPNDLISLYKFIKSKFNLSLIYPSSKEDLNDDGGGHLSYKLHPLATQIIKNILYVYPTIAWVWAAPNCKETILDSGPKYSWINMRLYRYKSYFSRTSLKYLNDNRRSHTSDYVCKYTPRSIKDCEIEFRMFTMPSTVKELENQIHFSQCLINYVLNLLASNKNDTIFRHLYGVGPYTFVETKDKLFKAGLNGLKENYVKICELIDYEGPIDFSRLEERYQYNHTYFM